VEDYLPTELLNSAVQWYHMALSHIRSSRLYDTMSLHFYHRNLKKTIEDFVSCCDTCQRRKLVGQGHGHVAPQEAELMPWRQIAVNLVGPWTLKVGPQEMTFTVIIDLVTNLVEIVRLNNKSSAHVALQFEILGWLATPCRSIASTIKMIILSIHLIYENQI
jgi:hypothetical protein